MGVMMVQASSLKTNLLRTLKIMNRRKALYFMMIPGIAFLFVFNYMPMYGAIIAFKNFAIKKGILASPWASPWYKYFEQLQSAKYSIIRRLCQEKDLSGHISGVSWPMTDRKNSASMLCAAQR